MSAARFPPGFLWGAATAAHQVEGGNDNSDCWALEIAEPSLFAEPSGAAADHYRRFEEDLALLADVGLNSYRFSVEWARIESEPGRYCAEALDHYARCVDACRARGVTPVVTFHHFTQPRWMARMGGMNSSEFARRFGEYCGKTAAALGDLGLACTLNELNLPVLAGAYFNARASDAERDAATRALGAPLSSFFLYTDPEAILANGLAAHAAARDAIRKARPATPVGMTLAISEEEAEPGAEAARDARRERGYGPFLRAAEDDDFIGVQTYSRTVSRRDGTAGPVRGGVMTSMGWEDRPSAVGAVCRWLAGVVAKPIYVTENGYPGEDDGRRAEFITEAVRGVRGAMADGADVRGYFYWSLLDNFEWLLGYDQKFGLISVNRESQERTTKRSARVLKSVIQEICS